MGLSQFRVGILLFALLIGIHAAWVLVAELVRPTSPPKDQLSFSEPQQSRAVAAAKLGVVRGDLWADGAILTAGGLRHVIEAPHISGPSDALVTAHVLAERAARFSPHDSRVWLLIAAIDARPGDLDATPSVGEPLKMSYYTGANDPALMGDRLRIATGSKAIADLDLQALISGEIRTILNSWPDLKLAIAAAYRNASPQGRALIESNLPDDSDLLGVFRRNGELR